MLYFILLLLNLTSIKMASWTNGLPNPGRQWKQMFTFKGDKFDIMTWQKMFVNESSNSCFQSLHISSAYKKDTTSSGVTFLLNLLFKFGINLYGHHCSG